MKIIFEELTNNESLMVFRKVNLKCIKLISLNINDKIHNYYSSDNLKINFDISFERTKL